MVLKENIQILNIHINNILFNLNNINITENNISINTDTEKYEMGFFESLFSKPDEDESKNILLKEKDVDIKNFNDLFQKYHTIEFGPWIIINGNLKIISDTNIYSYFKICNGCICEYHMNNGIIYKLLYGHTSKAILFSTPKGLEIKYTNVNYIS